ncbi:MAG: methyltransferase domain-containing protein [Acidimicrobiales bacterium]
MIPDGPATRRWAEALAAWAIPEEILAAAPESPWSLPIGLFAAPPEVEDTASRRRALEALPPEGSVLDVGAGGGAASLALAPPAAAITAVDQSPAMLASLSAAAGERGVGAGTVEGTWPDVAGSVGPADVVVCHHVVYNVAGIAAFLAALSDHARRRVVVEMTISHPMAGLNRLWRHFHRYDRPEGPTVDDFLAVVSELGIEASSERFSRPPRWQSRDRGLQVAFARRRLCLPAAADAEIDRLLDPDHDLIATQAACIWWAGRSS